MGLQYIVSSEQQMLLVSGSGDVRRGDMDDLRARLLADVRIVPGTRMLFDTRGAISHLSFSDLKDIANRLKGIFDRGVTTVAVVAESHLIYSLATTFGAFARYQPVEVKPFRKIEDARAWLESKMESVPAA